MKKVNHKRQLPVEITDQEMQTKQFLTIPEAAFVFRTSIRSISYLIKRQQLQAVRVSWKNTLISKDSISKMAEVLNTRHQSMLADGRKPIKTKVT